MSIRAAFFDCVELDHRGYSDGISHDHSAPDDLRSAGQDMTPRVSWRRTMWTRFRRWDYPDWKIGLSVGFYTSVLVLLSNIILLFIGCFSAGGMIDGIGTVAQGRPDRIQRLSTTYHIFINIMSTVLLVSSNYAMQILCSPTRFEVDAAHAQGMMLDIGLVSMHNLRFVARRRAILFWILACSSVPLHVFYNSAVFQVTAGQDYVVEMAYEGAEATKGWKRLENDQWRHLYGSPYVPGYGNLRLVVTEVAFGVFLHSNFTFSYELLDYKAPRYETSTGRDWKPRPVANNNMMLSFSIDLISQNYSSLLVQDYRATTTVSRLEEFSLPLYELSKPETVSLGGRDGPYPLCSDLPCADGGKSCSPTAWLVHEPLRIGYALAQPVEHSSKVQIGLYFMLIVIIANALKSISIYLTMRECADGHLITIGDALASYLENPEQEPKDNSISNRIELSKVRTMRRGHLWRHKSTHVFRLLGGGRLWSSLLLPFLASMCIALLALSLRDPEPTFYSSWGTSSQLLLQFTRSSFTTKGIIFTAWFANTPQVLLSIAYFSINRLCTSICSVIEWNNFGLHRKGLRVSSPSHLQRKTHFLQIPWRWSLPLTCTSGFLHWLLSQTLFLVRFEKRRVDGSLYPDESKCACGYSPLSFLIFTLCFLGLLLVLLWIVLRRVTAWMPPAGHSSLVISAACRPPDEDMYAHWGKVKWGLVVKGVGCEEEKVWCSFTSGSVRLPLGVDDD